jgi:hypothetical protein
MSWNKNSPENEILHLSDDDRYFSLNLGGPLYQLYVRSRLSTPALGLLRRRVVAISLFCWVPLLVLSLVDHHAFRGVAVPFLQDVEVHVRFLAALPSLVIAELIVHKRIVIVVRQFLERNIIGPEDRARFDEIVMSTMRLRNSAWLEILLLAFCFTFGYWIWSDRLTLATATWYAVKTQHATVFTKAGYWYAFVSLPIFRFLLVRWYFRLFLWYQFLWRVRGLKLRLNLYHPDRMAGLGFLGGSIPAFAPVLLAQTILLSGFIGSRIWHAHATLSDFKMEILGALVFLVLLVVAPLSFFVFHLELARRIARREFGILSSNYVDCFRDKWIQHTPPKAEPLLGTPDLQSLADLGNSFNTVNQIGLLPVGKQSLMNLVSILLLPLSPLVLTIVPLKDIVDWIIKLAF